MSLITLLSSQESQPNSITGKALRKGETHVTQDSHARTLTHWVSLMSLRLSQVDKIKIKRLQNVTHTHHDRVAPASHFGHIQR